MTALGGPRLIVAIVPRGEGDRLAGAAIRAGAQAATVFVGRAFAARQEVGASGLAVHAEKEILLTVVDPTIADGVVEGMRGAAPPGCGPLDRVLTIRAATAVGLLAAMKEGR